MRKFYFLILLVVVSAKANAEYCATGSITATECSGVVFQSCKSYELAYLENSNGRFEPAMCYSSVDEYNRKSNVCVKKVYESGGLNLLDYAVDKASLPSFFGVDKNYQIKEIEPTYIQFPCIKK